MSLTTQYGSGENKVDAARDHGEGEKVTAEVEVVFRNYVPRLSKLIADHSRPECFICFAIAWVTHPDILTALREAVREGARVYGIVQKENFWKPDKFSPSFAFQSYLRKQYDALGTVSLEEFAARSKSFLKVVLPEYAGGIQCRANQEDADEVSAIRCVGRINTNNEASFPRMHHKFMVFGAIKTSKREKHKPQKVWTGSFNASKAATRSFENATIISSPTVASSYFKEFCVLFMLSESLDWSHGNIHQEMTFTAKS